MQGFRPWVAYAALTLFTGIVALPAVAEMQVMSSTDPSYPISSRLPDDPLLNLGEGRRLRLRDLNTNKTFSLEGPYKGRLSQYKSRPSKNPGPANGGTMSVEPPKPDEGPADLSRGERKKFEDHY